MLIKVFSSIAGVSSNSCHITPGMLSDYPINSLAPGRSECDSKNVTFNLVLLIGIFRSSHDNALRWMPQDLTDDKSALVQVMAWCRQAPSHYLSKCLLRSMLPTGVTRPQWVILLWPTDVIWWHRSGWTLVQIMTCCLMASSHYLNQSWLIINEAHWLLAEGNFTETGYNITLWKVTYLKI